MSTGDHRVLDDLIHEHAVFASPAVFTPQPGRGTVTKYLRAAETMFADSGFRYVARWYATGSAVLEFVADIDGVHINGVDIIAWNAQDEITSFKVMIRPLRGLQCVIPRMGELLADAKSSATPRNETPD